MLKAILGAALIGLVLGSVYFFLLKDKPGVAKEPIVVEKILRPSPTAPKLDVTLTPPDYYFPIKNYEERITERAHGQYFKASDQPIALCGKPFQGFHAGDDLETMGFEKNSEVPIVAMTTGKIISVANVSGYGGLVVQEANLNHEPITIYYGHLDLTSVSLKRDDTVKAGQVIGNLGDDCSSETDFARKHLHFAIKKGPTVDVRGYVPTKDVLSSWLKPLDVLTKTRP